MKNKFIVDEEINLNESDFLKTKIYADNLTKIIQNAEPNKVFTIGLFGNWGTGKSSIVKTSEKDFDEKEVRFITYDAWQYVNDSFRRMFLRKLREDLRYEESDLMRKFYENESTDLGNKYQLSSTRLAIIIGGLILSLAILTFIPFDIDYKLSVFSIFTLLGLLITIISGSFHQLKISVTKPHLFAPEQFEECFKEIVSNSLSRTNTANRVLKWVRRNNSIQNLKKLVIVMDNIDRCSADIAYNLLTDVKTFLCSEPYSIVFVIPVDDDALKKHILKTGKEDCDKESEEFLRKFFNVTIRIKPYGETDMYSFAKQISEKSGIDFKPETINVASKEYAKSPRRIIQLFNNLLAEMNYYDADFIRKNETLICCIIIYREEYPGYYKKIINSPKIINEHYESEATEEGERTEELKRFIRISRTAFGHIELRDISKVLTNSHHHFDDIALDIKDAITTFDVEKVLTVWEKESDRLKNYIFDKIDNCIKNELIETELVAYFDFIMEINNSFLVVEHIAKRIDEKVIPYISIIISKTKNHENLCKYALTRESQKNKVIKLAIIQECKRIDAQEKDLHWASLFNAALITFKDKQTSRDLSTTYTIYHADLNFDLVNLSEEQIEFLISDKYIQDRISELPKNEESEELSLAADTEEYQKIVWLFENKKNISAETYAYVFAKIIGKNNDDSRMRGKSIDEIAEILNFINPLLELIPNRKLTSKPQTLYELIVNDRKIPHPSYPDDRRYDQEINFINECIDEEKYVQEIIDFVINIYRITNNQTEVQREIEKILKYINLNHEFVQLIHQAYTLTPFVDLILDYDGDSTDNERLFLLEHCFNQKDSKKEYVIDESKAKTKLDELLIYSQKENSQEVFDLLEKLSDQERYKTFLADLIVQKDSVFVNSLPKKLLNLAVNSFKRNNYSDFSNNFEFLSVIIQKGSKTQKGLVVKILINKLDENQDLGEVLNLIDSMDDIPSIDNSGLLSSHLDSYQNQNKETISEEINDRIEQLKKKCKPSRK